MDAGTRADEPPGAGIRPPTAVPKDGSQRTRWYTVNGTRLLGLLLFVLAAAVAISQPVAASGLAIEASGCPIAAAIETRGLS